MKRITSIFLVFALLITSIGISKKNEVYSAETTSKLKYHLDMGVYVVANVGGKWTNNVGYGSPQPYTANLTFNNSIKVKRVISINQAQEEGIDIWNIDICSNNIPNQDGKYKSVKDAYDAIYIDHISPSITNIQIGTGEGANIKYSYNAVLRAKMRIMT